MSTVLETSALRNSFAEYLGSAVLVCVVVGSGIMGSTLSQDAGIALLINAFSTILCLALLIVALGPISGAHLNPAVSLVQLIDGNLSRTNAFIYICAQVAGAITGALVANIMFDQAPLQVAQNARVSSGTLLSELIATAGLILVIGILTQRDQSTLISVAVPAWIGSAFFFTSSTSFANPSVTIGRIFSDTFAGIHPNSALPFISAQLVGATLGTALVRVTRPRSEQAF